MSHEIEHNTERRLPTHDEIAARARDICRERGHQPGYEIDDWLQAEYELMQLPIRKIAELEPPTPSRGPKGTMALVSLVHAALLLGVESLPHLRR